ncbi:response regulator [Helicobacter pametensis]|uniref:response regulator n=1 Tax=Helicobacter pametensis TaxID=95149 RepID=UPI000488356F|nr:response regulator [Helicobacter pametensis]
MNVLIVENEIYLAQSIATKLESLGYPCQIVSTIHEAMQKPKSDVVLLSANAGGSLCEMFIRQNPQAIVIMMIAYVSEDTVTKPIKAGAKDYIMKPFMLDELLRKIEHQLECQRLKKQIVFYEEYFSFLESEVQVLSSARYYPPFVIRCNAQKIADVYAIKIAKEKKMTLKFATLKLYDWRDVLERASRDTVMYVTHLESLRKADFRDFLHEMSDKNIIASVVASDQIDFPQVVDVVCQSGSLDFEGNILSVREYEKCIIQKFENHYSDVELAKKMGISRKNLWEKRKRYGLEKRKETDLH